MIKNNKADLWMQEIVFQLKQMKYYKISSLNLEWCVHLLWSVLRYEQQPPESFFRQTWGKSIAVVQHTRGILLRACFCFYCNLNSYLKPKQDMKWIFQLYFSYNKPTFLLFSCRCWYLGLNPWQWQQDLWFKFEFFAPDS